LKIDTNAPYLPIFLLLCLFGFIDNLVVGATLRKEVASLLAPIAELIIALHNCLPNDIEPWLMRAQCQHDEISVGAIDAVPCVGVVVGFCSLLADEVEDFVFALARNTCIRKYHRQMLPQWMIIQTLVDVVLQGDG
jgi:hypothetical protein